MTVSFLKIQNTYFSQLNCFRVAFKIQISRYLLLAVQKLHGLVILGEWSNNNLPIQSLLMQDQGTDIQNTKTLAPTTNSKYTVYEILWVFQKIFFFWIFYFWRMTPATFLSICMCWGGLQNCSLMSSTEFRKSKTQDLPIRILASVAR